MDDLESETLLRNRGAAAFARMFWAFLFLELSLGPTFRIGSEQFTIDLLPDFVGYILIAAGANFLLSLHARARGVRNLALLLNFLALPECVQYTVQTTSDGQVTWSVSPLWPLSLLLALLNLVLVWRLCGIVADLADQAGAWEIARKARFRRNLYVWAKVLMTPLVCIGLISPSPVLIVTLVVAGFLVGVVLLCLMMGLMSQARRLCLTTPDIHGLQALASPRLPSRADAWVVTFIRVVGLVVPLLLAAGSFYYYLQWEKPRNVMRTNEQSGEMREFFQEFQANLRAGRLEEAYQMTSPTFQARVSREQFADLTRRYIAFQERPSWNAHGTGVSGGAGPQELTDYKYGIDIDWKKTTWSFHGRRPPDSIFFFRMPSPKIDDFKVTEEDARVPNPAGHPFGANPP